ncbi:MAG: DNA translocase FtsK 4TM domain-containing protein [Oligoflexales bacterium]|nr:DNA translocase FtsK 4TM domain-containing protein [Oligoflexales bacterium]
MQSEKKVSLFHRVIIGILGFRPLSLGKAFQREALFVLIWGLAAFFLVSMYSFSPLDPSPYSKSFPPQEVTNLCGKAGATISGFFIFHMGYVACLIPIPLMFMSLMLILDREKPFGSGRILGFILILLTILCVVSEFYPYVLLKDIAYPSAGALGREIFKNMTTQLGRIGYRIALVTAVIYSMILISQTGFIAYTIKALGRLLSKIKNPFSGIFVIRRNSKIRSDDTEKSREGQDEPSPELPFVSPMVQTSPQIPIDISPMEEPRIEEIRMEKKNTCYEPPPSQIFKTNPHTGKIGEQKKKEYEETAKNLTKAFSDFSIKGEVVGIEPGPVVTVFEFEHTAGTKLSKMTSLIDDIALALKVDSIFMYPVSGKRVVGVQIPNIKRDMVYFGDIVQSRPFIESTSPLTFAMGKTLKGEAYCADLSAMPHLLMAGQTGSGKSVAINSLLCSIILKSSPRDVKMILVDPKVLELKIYEGIPHLLMPVITEPQRASAALKWATEEMDRRYRLMEIAKVRHITGFNQFWHSSSDQEKNRFIDRAGTSEITKLPYIIVVIDEMADLMLTAPKDVESSIQRLAQKARACGIHLVLATQRPSVDVITGVIKANLPCRIAFKVFSRADSRTILDSMGPEKLLGKGDMLYLRPGSPRLERIQGAFLEDREVLEMVEQLKNRFEPEYDDSAISWIEENMKGKDNGDEGSLPFSVPAEEDPKWDDALLIAQKQGMISASFLQRQLKIGYNRAARIVETMEAKGLVSKADGAKPRKWLNLLL